MQKELTLVSYQHIWLHLSIIRLLKAEAHGTDFTEACSKHGHFHAIFKEMPSPVLGWEATS